MSSTCSACEKHLRLCRWWRISPTRRPSGAREPGYRSGNYYYTYSRHGSPAPVFSCGSADAARQPPSCKSSISTRFSTDISGPADAGWSARAPYALTSYASIPRCSSQPPADPRRRRRRPAGRAPCANTTAHYRFWVHTGSNWSSPSLLSPCPRSDRPRSRQSGSASTGVVGSRKRS